MKQLVLRFIVPLLLALSTMRAQTIEPRRVFSISGSRVIGLHAIEHDRLQVKVENWREPDKGSRGMTQYDLIEWNRDVEVSRRPITKAEARRYDDELQLKGQSDLLKITVSPATGRGVVETSNGAENVDFAGDAEIKQYISHASKNTPVGAVPSVISDIAVDQEEIYVLYPVLYPKDRTTLIARFRRSDATWTFRVFRLKLPDTIIYPVLIAARGGIVFIGGEANKIALYESVQ